MKVFSILLVAFLLNCSYNWGNFKEYSLEAPANLEVVGTETVRGEDCGQMLFFLGTLTGWWTQSLSGAIANALQKAPGATGLKDVTVTAKHGDSLILACMYVEGTPVKELAASAPPAKTTKGKK